MCSLYRVNIWHNVSDVDGGGVGVRVGGREYAQHVPPLPLIPKRVEELLKFLRNWV